MNEKDQKTEDVQHIEVHELVALDEGAQVRITDTGMLIAMPRAARTGIQLYKGIEVGRPEMDVVRVYRPESEVFKQDSLSSYAHKPVTNNHPKQMVTAANWKDHAKGWVGEEILRDGKFIRVPMMLADAGLVKDINEGKRELSWGYSMDLVWGEGVTVDGEEYDATQTNIRANHLAVVAKARGGPDLKIGDKATDDDSQYHDEEDVMEIKTQTMVIDGETFVVDQASVGQLSRFIDNLKKKIDAFTSKLSEKEEESKKEKDAAVADAKAEHQKEVEAKDAEIATLKKQLEDAQDPAQLDQRVADRASIVEKAKGVLGNALVTDGRSNEDIKRQVVDKFIGADAKEWSDDAVTASFNTIVKANDGKGGTQPTDPIRRTFNDGIHNARDARDAAYADYEKDLKSAWQGQRAADPNQQH